MLKLFLYVISFNLYNTSFQMRKLGPEMLSNLPKGTQLVDGFGVSSIQSQLCLTPEPLTFTNELRFNMPNYVLLVTGGEERCPSHEEGGV